jgi:hypothetical protein
MTDNNKQNEQPKFSTFNNFTVNPPITNAFTPKPATTNSTPVVNTFTNFTPKPATTNSTPVVNTFTNFIPIPPSLPTIVPQPPPEPPRQLTRYDVLDKEITDAIRDLIFIFEKCKIKTDDLNNENERGKMMKIIEVYYESCNNIIVQLALAEIYKGLKKESYMYKIKYEEMDFDVPDFTYVCFRDYVKKQFDKMQFHINKYY